MLKRKNAKSTPVFGHPRRGETSTPPRLWSGHPRRGESWNPQAPYLYWEVPKNKLLTDRARELRKAGNLAEVIFWQAFKDKKKFDFDIDRQVIIGNFIVDFFIPELGLVFEIDGASHDDKVEYDAERDAFMRDLRLKIIRIPDLEVKKNLGKVYEIVLHSVTERACAFQFPSSGLAEGWGG